MLQVFGTRHSVPRRRTAIASTMVRSTMLRLAVTALLAVVASAQPGVVLFAEGEHQGALLHTPSPGSLACAEDPRADCAALDPSAAAAAVAALLRVNPVEPVDAHASSQVRASPHRTAWSPDPTRAIPPSFPPFDAFSSLVSLY